MGLLALLCWAQLASPVGDPKLCDHKAPELRRLIEKAEIVITARTTALGELPTSLRSRRSQPIRTSDVQLDQIRAISGNPTELGDLAVSYVPESCIWEPGYTLHNGRRHLLFLGKEDEKYRVLGQLPKGEWIEEEWETGVVQLLDQWHRVQELTDPEKFQEQAMEWLIAMAQNPATRGQAAAELHPMRCHNKEHHSDVLCLTIQSASPSQKDRLIQILDDGEDVSEGDLLLYETLRDSTDPRLGQFLLNYLERWETIPALEAYGWRFPEAAAEIWIYDMVTRSQNKDALEYFRDNWKGSISEWRYVGNEVSQFEALQELIRMIRLSQEC